MGALLVEAGVIRGERDVEGDAWLAGAAVRAQGR